MLDENGITLAGGPLDWSIRASQRIMWEQGGLQLGALFQAFAIYVVLSSLGNFFGRTILRRLWPALPLYRRICYRWILGSVLAALLGPICSHAPAGIRIAVLLICVFELYRSFEWARHGGDYYFWKNPLSLLPLVGIPFFIALPLSPYPGPISAGYGDLVSYYRIGTNLLTGLRPLIDFRIGDYQGELYKIPIQYPMPICLIAFWKNIFPTGIGFLESYCIISGLLGLFFASNVLWCSKERSEPSYWLILSFALLPLAFSDLAFDFGLGAMTLPVFLPNFILLDLFKNRRAARLSPTFLSLVFIHLLSTLLWRPEGALLTSLTIAWIALLFSLRAIWKRDLSRFNLALITVTVTGILMAVGFLGKVTGESGCYRYYWLDENQENFQVGDHAAQPWTINTDNVRESLGLKRVFTPPNPHFFKDALLHPGALTKFVLFNLANQFGQVQWLIVLLLLVGSVIQFDLTNFAVGLSLFSYLPALVLINLSFTTRHVLASMLISLFWALMSLEEKYLRGGISERVTNRVGWVIVPILLIAAIANSTLVYQERADKFNAGYVPIIAQLKKLTVPTSIVASDYPQLISFALGTGSVGNSNIVQTLGPLVEKYHPDFIVISDARPDLLKAYEAFQYLYRGRLTGYKLVVNSVEDSFVILGRL